MAINPLLNLDRSKNKEISLAKLNTALDSITDKQRAYVEYSPDKLKRLIADAFVGKSLSKAIKAKCLTCCNFSKEDISDCRVEVCPLHSVRPFRKKEDKDDEDMYGED